MITENLYITPAQTKSMTAYNTKLFIGELDYTKSYIDININELTNLIGNDIIINGCEITNISIINNVDIMFSITPGLLIHDNTICEILSTANLTIKNAANYSSNGKFIVYTKYKNNNSSEENSLNFAVTHFNNNHKTFDVFDPNSDRIILGAILFNKNSNGNIIETKLINSGVITINSKQFNIRPTKEEYLTNYGCDGGFISPGETNTNIYEY